MREQIDALLSEAFSRTSVARSVRWITQFSRPEPFSRDAMLAKVRSATSAEWLRIDEAARSVFIDSPRAEAFDDVDEWPPNDRVHALGLASMTSSGYTREAAVRRLEALQHPDAIPYLLIRCGDWVTQVRGAAFEAVQSLLRAGWSASFSPHCRLVDRLRRMERADASMAYRPIEQRLRELLLDDESPLLETRDGIERLFLYRLLGEDIVSHDRLLYAALSDPDAHVRAWVAAKVRSRAELTSDELWARLISDRGTLIAVPTIRALHKDQASRLHPQLIRASVADAQAIRLAARTRLNPADRAQVLSLARQEAALPPRAIRPGVIATLGELGDGSADAGLIRPWLGSTNARTRQAALRAVAKLDPNDLDMVLNALADPSSRVRLLAIRIALTRAWHEVSSRLAALVQDGTPQARLGAISVLMQRMDWDHVPTLLRAVAEHDEVIDAAWTALERWTCRIALRGWMPLPSAVRAELRAALALPGVRAAVDQEPDVRTEVTALLSRACQE